MDALVAMRTVDCVRLCEFGICVSRWHRSGADFHNVYRQLNSVEQQRKVFICILLLSPATTLEIISAFAIFCLMRLVLGLKERV